MKGFLFAWSPRAAPACHFSCPLAAHSFSSSSCACRCDATVCALRKPTLALCKLAMLPGGCCCHCLDRSWAGQKCSTAIGHIFFISLEHSVTETRRERETCRRQQEARSFVRGLLAARPSPISVRSHVCMCLFIYRQLGQSSSPPRNESACSFGAFFPFCPMLCHSDTTFPLMALRH